MVRIMKLKTKLASSSGRSIRPTYYIKGRKLY